MAGRKWSRAILLWLTPVVFFAAAIGGVRLVLDPPEGIVGIVLGALVVVGLGWILTSILWPARADRRCPACGEDALERLDLDSTVGLRCSACGHTDETASAWYLAEEEGPLEEIVLEERRTRAAARGRAGSNSPRSPVDSGGGAH